MSDCIFSTLGFEGVAGWGGRTLQAGGEGAVCLSLPLSSWVTIVEGLPEDVFAIIRAR
jgi:hypothetical protein